MTSIVIAAHNEAGVLDRCLASVLRNAAVADPAQVVVVPNGCTDDTARVARRHGVTVVELAEPGKAAALNAGDAAATGFPRVYLDADVLLADGGIDLLVGELARTGALAAVPARRMELAGRSPAVRAYYAIHSRLPAVVGGLYGRGVIALSRPGRERFGRFPDQVADDLFLDSLFAEGERRVVTAATVRVAAPMRTGDLIRRLVRVRAGNAALRDSLPGVRRSRRSSWLTDVVLRAPRLSPAAVCYVVITLLAERGARRAARTGRVAWAHDRSSRAAGGKA
ncbi:glycosyltransferase family 2 protein [Micromonospora sp. C28SCA-DRY-2]|uniref:glycosyltransferase family 2 protein n=1 Tax=Micromonospora sp. C28SCA-DRY-2 TaxID=3059522 RepID=UPI002675E4FE|nr:glycosyltransferase family 2 protein [Micromonospora sp. C28SCA-DRY-2]MDO3704288.1 glycosyltransferase family 2 protein [Micromonospora sp. C28SCA-DRY-2]